MNILYFLFYLSIFIWIIKCFTNLNELNLISPTTFAGNESIFSLVDTENSPFKQNKTLSV